MDAIDIAAKVALYYIPFLFSLCFHELSHAFVAKLRGDNTGEMMGRISMSPFAHADTLGTFILPIMGITMAAVGTPIVTLGWAKPVPVNPRNFKSPKNDWFLVAIAGPGSNVLLAIISAVLYVLSFMYLEGHQYFNAIVDLLTVFIQVNLMLAVFNMLPFHPLDGGKVLERFIPYNWNRKLEEHQMALNMGLLFFFILGGGYFIGQIVFFLHKHLLQGIGSIFL